MRPSRNLPSRIPVIRLRLLGFTMLVAFLLLGVKLGDIVRDGKQISQAWIGQATAQQAAPPSEGQAVPTADSAAAPAAEPAAQAEADAAEPQPAADAANAGADATPPVSGAAAAKKKKQEEAMLEGKVDSKPPTIGIMPGAMTGPQFTQVEIDLLQTLSKRRDEIESWAKDVQLKETMLGATEQRISDKIAQMKRLQKDLEALLVEYNKHEDAKIRSLVKIYENMKPADAARIFDEMDIPIMLEVVDKMAEKKAAPILAKMLPERAKELTVELAAQRRLQQPMLDSIAATRNDAPSESPQNATAPGTAQAPADAGDAGVEQPSPGETPPTP